MDLNFSEAIQALGGEAGFREIANEARPDSAYLFNTLLPEVGSPSYDVKSGNLTIRSTMAGLSATSSPYPKGGFVESSTFMKESAKIANEVEMQEETQRRLHDMVLRLMGNNSPTSDFIQGEVLNFFDKLILQPHLDTMEYLRGQALTLGKIDWTFNKQKLTVDYGVKSDHLLTNRTGNDAYSGSASKFWADVRTAMSLLRWNVATVIMHSSTLDDIILNDVNKIQVEQLGEGRWRLRKLIEDGSGRLRDNGDARNVVEVVTYDLEAEVMDLSDTTQTIKIPFLSPGKIIMTGRASRNSYRVGEGSTDNPDNDLALGYTHIAPTVEGGGAIGRWGKIYVPQDDDYILRGKGVTNGLPVIENPDKLVVLSTDMSS